MTNTLSILAVALLLAACGPDPDMKMRKQTMHPERPTIQENTRFEVARVGVFADDLAYDSRRGIYIITDTETGMEFVGVSGIGITELGRHSCGKGCSRADER